MAGYVRQSSADIVPTAIVRATPINNEYNALRDAFAQASGHRHDGTAAEGAYVPLISDSNNRNKVVTDSSNNRVGVFISVSSSAVEQVRFQDGAFVPVTDNDIDLGTSSLEFKDLYIDGTANIDSLVADTADINGGTIDASIIGGSTAAAGTFTTLVANTSVTTPSLTVNTSAVIASADINAGTIDGTVIGGASAQAITGTTITATTGFVGPLTGAVTGNVTGNLTGNVTGNVTGNLTGNVTASSGSSTFNNVTINGTLNMDASSAATITNITDPTNAQDAATKNYVDTAISNLIDTAPGTLDTLNELAAALGDDPNFATTITNSIATKLALAGGTMSGAIAMGTNKITGLGNPTANQDAATKVYVDTADATKLSLSGGTMTGAIAMGTNKITGMGDPTSAQDAATKNYIDTLFGSTTSAAASAAAAATSASNAATSASNASTSATNAAASASAAAASYDSFDDRYLGAKSSAPTLDNDGNALLTGALYFSTASNLMYVYTGSSWVAAGSSVNGTSSRQVYTATASQTTFAITYDVGFVDVYLNGVKLVVGTDFTATSGTNIVLATGATAGDIVDIIAYGSFNVANTYTQAAADAKFLQVANNLSDLASAATARSNLGLVIGTNVLAYDSNLQSFVTAFTLPTTDGSANQVLRTNGSGTLSFGTLGVAGGGTGATTLTANNVILGNGTSAVQFVAPGANGNVLTSNGTTWTSAAVGSGVEFVATGSISAAGTTVALNSDGTVSAVTGQSEAVGSTQAYTTNVNYTVNAVAYNESGSQVFMAYRSNTTGALFGIAGTVNSSGTITWGTPVQLDPSINPSFVNVVYCPNVSRFFVFYCDSTTTLRYVGSTVSGTTITAGTVNTYKTVSSRSDWVALCYNAAVGSLIVMHQEYAAASYFVYATACTISGDTLTRGTEQYVGQSYGEASITFVGNSRFILNYQTTSSWPQCRIFVNSSGNASTLSNAFSVNSNYNATAACVYDSYNDVILFFLESSSTVLMQYRQVTAISDTSLTLGTQTTFLTNANSAVSLFSIKAGIPVAYDSKNRKITLIFRANTGGTPYAGCYIVTGYWSAGAFVSRTPVQLSSVPGDTSYYNNNLIYLGTTIDKFFVVYTNSTSSIPVVRTFTNEASSNINTIGIAQAAASNGQSVAVKLPYQIDANQSGLTPGSNYYVAGNGTLTTSAGTTNFLIGKAVSATRLLITKWSL